MNQHFKRFVTLFILLMNIVICFSGCFVNTKNDTVDNFRVTTYIRGDYVQSADSLNADDFNAVTHAILFECASFDSEGKVIYEKEKLETALNKLRTAIGERDVHISLNLLGPDGETDSNVWEEQMEAKSEQHNKAFKSGVLEDNIIKILDEYDFDGVHFDYEYPISRKAQRGFNKFLVSLGERLDDYSLGVAISDWNVGFNSSAIKEIDTFELMVYDFVDEQGRHATYEGTLERLANKNLKRIPNGKINIGLPFYSRPTDLSEYWYGYNSCYEKIGDDGWYHCDETGKDFWFNTTDVIKKKTEYAINNGYGGVMIWHYSCDIPIAEEKSLMGAVNTVIEDNYRK